MGEKVECPNCGNNFYVHGYEELADCYNCNSMFNPQRNMLDNGDRKVYMRGG